MPRNILFQDYCLTHPNFKLWVRKSDDKTAFCSNCRKKIDVTVFGGSALEDKDKNRKLKTPVAGSGSLLGHLEKPQSEQVTKDFVRIQLLTINPHSYQ